MKNNIEINNRGVHLESVNDIKKKLLKRMGSKGETKSDEKKSNCVVICQRVIN